MDDIKSDDLISLRKMFSEGGIFSQFGNLFEIRLIIDANAILKDIRFLLLRAKSPEYRTDLLELLDCKTIIAYAPTFLKEEMLKNIPILVEKYGLDITKANQKWRLFENKIRFVDVGGAVKGEIDPKDAPYVKLAEKLDLRVLSKDSDISKMGAKVINFNVLISARNYSRQAAIEYSILANGLTVLSISSQMTKAVIGFVKSLGDSIKIIPAWVWLIVIVGVAYLLSNESFRSLLKSKIATLPELSRKLGSHMVELLEPSINQYRESQEKANKSKAEVIKKMEEDEPL